jgi:hypothetical protein
MGLKTNTSPVDTRLFKMEVVIKNIAFFTVVGNLAVNQLMERKVITTITTKDVSTKEPKWTTVMVKNMCQVVSGAMETLTDAPKQEEHKLNLCLTGFEAKEGETEKELVQQFNTELLRGQMGLHAKVIAATQQWLATAQASTLTTSACPSAILLKFVTSEDRQAALQRPSGD